jgi:hypothetical protein
VAWAIENAPIGVYRDCRETVICRVLLVRVFLHGSATQATEFVDPENTMPFVHSKVRHCRFRPAIGGDFGDTLTSNGLNNAILGGGVY